MKKRVLLTLTTFAFMLACGAAFAEESPGIRSHGGHSVRGHVGTMGCGMMGRGGMMGGSGMMGGGGRENDNAEARSVPRGAENSRSEFERLKKLLRRGDAGMKE